MSDESPPCSADSDFPSIKELRAGDRAAWEKVFPRLRAVACAVVRDVMDASSGRDYENAASQALMEVSTLLMNGDSGNRKLPSSFEQLLGLTATIARRRSIDAIRREKSRPAPPPDFDPNPDIPGPLAMIGSLESPRLTQEEILNAVDSLKPPLPDMFRERYLEGLELAEIADKHGLSYKNVTVMFTRAFKTLRQKLNPLLEDPA